MCLPKRVLLTFSSQQILEKSIISLSNTQKKNSILENDVLRKLKIIEKKISRENLNSKY